MNLFTKLDFSSVADDEDILPYLRNDSWFQQAAAERTMGELTELRERMNRFDDTRVQLIQELVALLALHPRILAQPPSQDRSRGLAELTHKVSQLKERLSHTYHSFLRNSYRRYLPPETGGKGQDTLIQELRSNLVNRFESIVKPDVEKCLNLIDLFIIRCNAAEK